MMLCSLRQRIRRLAFRRTVLYARIQWKRLLHFHDLK
jgi:hypothetical protein